MKKLSLLLGSLVLWSCSTGTNNEVAGGPGSETTNGIVAMVNGSPASFAGVAMRKVDFVVDEFSPENALVQPDAYANENGNFVIDSETKDPFRLTVVHGGSAYTKVISPEEIADMDTVVLQPTGAVNGVIDVEKGSEFVWVGVVGMDVMVRSDANGEFSLPQLPSTDSLELYFVQNAESKISSTAEVMPVAFQSQFINLTNPDTAEDVRGFVATIDGKPAVYAMAALRPVDFQVTTAEVENSAIVPDYYSDSSGRFSFDLPDSGKYRLTVVKDGFSFSKEYSAQELADIDTLRLNATASVSSKVTLRSSDSLMWVGVYGLDLLVKTNDVGAYVLPNVPANDTLGIYFVTADSSHKLYTEWNASATSSSTEFLSPVKVLQNFEGKLDGWYVNTDALYKGTTLTPAKNVADGVEYDSTRKSKVFHGKYKLADDDYAWVLVGTMFEHEMNFSAIDSVVFYAKGDGNIRLSLENYINDTQSLKAATEWLPLSKNWKRISVNPAELCVGNAKTETCFTSWSGVKKVVKQLHIFSQDGSEFYIDDITLYGALF
ncbi:carboxypeptidase-like regulatory domain-containing protein [Fibrobacter sp. UBA4309]|uniref:carboxypeptidase-like regulatory domain-containing protein n=1 Tax=Fibrobacter sp. UBA4309 TaxID=1946537 RepID=UPI0025B9C8FF|nr:carboxypeptidase-like regulatory domain-containing protein [Fibrobacter sp. UBA4309]